MSVEPVPKWIMFGQWWSPSVWTSSIAVEVPTCLAVPIIGKDWDGQLFAHSGLIYIQNLMVKIEKSQDPMLLFSFHHPNTRSAT